MSEADEIAAALREAVQIAAKVNTPTVLLGDVPALATKLNSPAVLLSVASSLAAECYSATEAGGLFWAGTAWANARDYVRQWREARPGAAWYGEEHTRAVKWLTALYAHGTLKAFKALRQASSNEKARCPGPRGPATCEQQGAFEP